MPGCSLVKVKNKVHAFIVGDKSYPQSEKIYVGYVPEANFVLHDVEEEAKEDMLHSHRQKLAIVFGLINASPGTPIRITKNLESVVTATMPLNSSPRFPREK